MSGTCKDCKWWWNFFVGEPLRRMSNAISKSRGYGGCFHCGDTWNRKPHYSIPYCLGRGMFPVCEECFYLLTEEEIIQYISLLVGVWRDIDNYDERVDLDVMKQVVSKLKSGMSYQEVELWVWNRDSSDNIQYLPG